MPYLGNQLQIRDSDVIILVFGCFYFKNNILLLQSCVDKIRLSKNLFTSLLGSNKFRFLKNIILSSRENLVRFDTHREIKKKNTPTGTLVLQTIVILLCVPFY